MKRVAVVTDSASDVRPCELDGLGVSVVPLEQAGLEHRDGAAGGVGTLAVTRTLVDAFAEVYEVRARSADAILSIHVSHRLAGAVDAAREARGRLRGVLPIEVVDSGAATFALGFVVRRAARAAQAGANLAELDFLTRRALQNVHVLFFGESVAYLSRPGQISGNGMRPLLQLEEGEVRPLERVRTRARGYDRLAEFVELFPHVDGLAILHDAPPQDLELLMRRIEPLYPRDQIVVGEYGPVVRARVGPHAIGVIVDQGIGYD